MPMEEPTIAAANAADAATQGLNGRSHEPSPALRLLAEDEGLIRRRPAVIAAGLAARLRLLRGYAIWPGPEAPVLGIDPSVPAIASWMQATFEPGASDRALRRATGPATWNVLRASGFLRGSAPSWLLELCGELLGRDASRASLTLFSRSGATLSKAIYFLFEKGAREPSLVMLAMADPSQSARLELEYDAVETLASALDHDPETASALPVEPLFRGAAGGEYLVVVPPDPLATAIGRENRTVALDWLLRLQTATGSGTRAWEGADSNQLLAVLDEAWGVLRPQTLPAVRDRVGSQLEEVRGSPVPRCAVHGDYWHGNIAVDGDRLRVYDWEWASMDGLPFLDLWTYEFGVLLRPPPSGAPAGGLAAAVGRLEAELARRDVASGFALATVAPSLAQLAIRMRRVTGRPGPAEGALAGLIEEAELLLLQD
jgi:hypothetical protein